MAITDTQKIDYLWKKLGYGVSKTDQNSIKNATNESIASPLLIRGDKIWTEAATIPSVIPSSSSLTVEIYDDTGNGLQTVETTNDATATANRTWKTGITDWIPPEFGSTYQVKVYIDSAGAANPQSSGSQIFAAGSGNDDQWFFDYQSGVLHFIGNNLPSGISGNVIYVAGARYKGAFGTSVPGAITEGDLQGSVFGDDSSLLVDGVGNIIVGDVVNSSVITNALYTPLIDTQDSSTITIVPAVIFNSDITVENDIVANNKITANEYVGPIDGGIF